MKGWAALLKLREAREHDSRVNVQSGCGKVLTTAQMQLRRSMFIESVMFEVSVGGKVSGKRERKKRENKLR
jgi:hypothetical protein